MRNSTAYQIEILLIRHGKTPGNLEKRYIGRTDESLSEEGKEELMGKHLPEADLYFSGPMKRCVETARILFGDRKLCLIEQYKEIDFGVFEGHNYRELSEDPRYQAWIDSGGTMTFPEGESREDFCKRSVEGFREMMDRIRKEMDAQERGTATAAAVVHGGTIMAVLSGIYSGDYYDYQIGNGEAYKILVQMTVDEMQIVSAERVTL